MKKIKDTELLGKTFNRLKAIAWADSYVSPKGSVKRKLLCECSCGNTLEVLLARVSSGMTKSCGCLKYENRYRTHGMTNTPTYISWASMMNRCNNKKDNMYGKYGGDGVSVCSSWHDFERFYQDMGERPEGCTINRTLGSKLYSKRTCSWDTLSVQAYDQKKRSSNTSGRTGVYRRKKLRALRHR